MMQKVSRHIREFYQLYLFVMPAFTVVLLFHYYPMYGIQLAFREFEPLKGLTGGEFVGLKYFTRFIDSYQFWSLMRNTFLISFYSLLFGFPIPIAIALLFNQIRVQKAKRLMQTVVYMPHFISVIAIVGMIFVFVSPSTGLLSHLLRLFDLTPVNVMGEVSYFRFLYVSSEIWQHAGWNSIIFMATLSGIDPHLYEAAKVDGASRIQQIINIDIPHMLPTVIILLILNTGSILSVGFEKIFLMQNGINLSVSEVLSTYVYKIGILSNQISYSSAIGLFNTIINFIMLVMVNAVSRYTSRISLW